MDVVVEKVAEARNQTGASGLVVVGAEHGNELRVSGEVRTNTSEGIGVNSNICIDENEDVAVRPFSAEVSSLRRAERGRLLDDNHLVWHIARALNRFEAGVKRERPIRRRHDRRNAGHSTQSLGQLRPNRPALSGSLIFPPIVADSVHAARDVRSGARD